MSVSTVHLLQALHSRFVIHVRSAYPTPLLISTAIQISALIYRLHQEEQGYCGTQRGQTLAFSTQRASKRLYDRE